MHDQIYFDGTFRPVREAAISPLAGAVLFGEGLFETVRCREGKLPFLDRHLFRLRTSAAALSLPSPPTNRELRDLSFSLLERNRVAEGLLRITLMGGENGPHLLISTRSIEPWVREVEESGIGAVTLSPSLSRGLPTHKHLGWLPSLVGLRLAREAGAREGIFTASSGALLEGCATNLFVVRDGRLITPSVKLGLLPGITRGIVIELAGEMGMETVEGEIQRGELLEGDEAFLTGSGVGILPLAALDGVPVGKSVTVTKALRERYEELMRRHEGLASVSW